MVLSFLRLVDFLCVNTVLELFLLRLEARNDPLDLVDALEVRLALFACRCLALENGERGLEDVVVEVANRQRNRR